MIPRLAFLGLYSIGVHLASVFLVGLGGIVSKFENAVASWIREAGEKIDGLFDVTIEIFLHVENPYGVPKANEAWMNAFEVALAIFPVMIILGLLSMPFADEQKTSLWRQGLRIVGVIAIIAVLRPLIGFGVDLSNTMVTALMPSGTNLLNIINPFSAGMGSLSNVMSGFALALVIWFIGWYSLIAVGIVLVLLELRVFFIYLVYIASPVLAVFWYADWGLLKSVNEFANKWARMGIYTLLSGPIIAIIFRTMVVIADGALMQGFDGVSEGVAAFWSQFILVTCFPIIMIAAIWKIVSWAGEPIGAGQAMTGMTMAFGAAIGGAKVALGGEGSVAEGVSSGSQVGQKASSIAGSGGGGGGGGGSGTAPGVASDAGGTNPGQNSVAQAVQDQEGQTVSASGDTPKGTAAGTGSATASGSGASSSSQGGLNGDVPGGTGDSGGPSDEVTGTSGPSDSDEESQGYINAAKERYGNFKERNAAKMKHTISNYKDKAKDRLNPTNLERHYADHKRSQAEGVEQQRQHFEGAVDMGAGENGTIDLAQAEESGALSDSVKATNYDTPTSSTAELNKDGTFQYRNENDEMVTGSVGAKRQQFRDEKAQLESQVEAHEARADSIDESMSYTGSRLKKTGSNLKSKYGPAIQASRQAFGQEMVRGTVGAHSPYLMAGGDGIFGGGQRGGGGGEASGQNPDVGTHEHEESVNRPNAAIRPSTAKEHEDVLAESGDRFDAMGEELNYVPGGGRTPDGVAQQGYVETAEDGKRVGAVEVSEDSDVRLPTDNSFRMGNVKMGKRDGSQAQSLPEERGEYGTFQVDDHSRLLDENETRVDQVIGNDEMVGEEAQFKDMLIRKADSDPEDYAAQYYGESPTGERMPINVPNDETEQVLDDHLGERVDLTGTVQNEYGMSTNTHPEYEGAHDYAVMEVDLADQGEGGSPNTTTEGGDASSAKVASEASTEDTTSARTESAGGTGYTGHSINASGDVGNSSSGGSGGSTGSPPNGHNILQSSSSGSSSDSASGSSFSGSASGESMSAEEMIEKGGEGQDRVSSDDTFVVENSQTDSDKHANSYKLRKANEDGEAQGEPIFITRMGAEAGPPELDEPEDPPAMRDQHRNDLGRQDPKPGDVVTDLEGFKYGSYGEDWNGAHEDVDASSHGGEDGMYTELRPDKESSLTVLNRGSDADSESQSEPDGSSDSTSPTTGGESSSPSTVEDGGTESDAPRGTESTTDSNQSKTTSREAKTSNRSTVGNEVSPANEADRSSDGENATSETEPRATKHHSNESVDYGGTVEADEKSIPADDIDGVESLNGERVDAKGVGGTDILGDAQLESTERDSNSRVQLADKTRDNEIAEYGEGALSNVKEGESFEIQNGEAVGFNGGSHAIQMDENTIVEETADHEGDPTVSIGSDRKKIDDNGGNSGGGQGGAGGDDNDGHGGSGGSDSGGDDGPSGGGSANSNSSQHESTSTESTSDREHDTGSESGSRESAQGEGHSAGAESSGVSTQQVDTVGEIEEAEVENAGLTSNKGNGGENTGDGVGEGESELGDEDHPQNPGSGASTAGEQSSDLKDASGWEDRAHNWREHIDESESETLSEGAGFTAESMRVETLDDGERVFITDYDDLDQSMAEEDIINPVQAEELKHQSLVGHEWTESMGQEVPNVAYNEDTNEIIQQEAGGADTETWGITEAPDEALEQVDRDDYEETMAVQLLGGNLDTNEDNIHVDENGGLHVIDFDRTASPMGEVDNADEMEINAGAAGRVGEKIGKVNTDFHTDRFQYESEVTDKAAEIATELEENGETEDVLSSVEEVDQMHSGDSEPRTPIIRHNIESIANEEVEIESSSGASQEELDEIFDELNEEDADGEGAEK